MRFRELQDRDDYNAFDNYMSVIEAKKQGIIPEDYVNIFQDECKCGSDMIIRLTPDENGHKKIKAVQCCDPRCYIKVAGNLSYFLERLGIKDFGMQTAIKLIHAIYNDLEHKSHFDVFFLPIESLPELSSLHEVALAQANYKLLNEEMSLSQVLSLGAIPAWETSIQEVMQNYSDMDEVLVEIEEMGSIRAFLAQYNIRSEQKLFYFKEYLPDMCILASLLGENKLRPKAKQPYDICITGSLVLEGNRITKAAFVELLNRISRAEDGTQLFEFKNTSGPMTASYVVADAPSSSAKYKAGLRANNLITSDKLYNKVIKAVKLYNEEIRELS